MGLNLFQDGGSGSFFLLKVVEGDICGEESFHHHVTAVACKRPRSFCQKCGWQVTAKYTAVLEVHHFGGYSKTRYEKPIHSCRITCERSESAGEWRIALYKSSQQQQQKHGDFL